MSFFDHQIISPNQFISSERKVELYLKREDQIDEMISGNKFRKLKYNLVKAKKEGHHTLLTYGGAFSNHIAAVAKAGKQEGFKTIGIIRGEELARNLDHTLKNNDTLAFAHSCGMQLHFVDRSTYRDKNTAKFREEHLSHFEPFYEIPEGGTNTQAISGCKEILTVADLSFDYICCAVGTGGTIAGIIEASGTNQKVLGFPALKGDFLKENIKKYIDRTNWELVTDYHFGGYGRVNKTLVEFINAFNHRYGIPLDPIYTGKMLFGIQDMIDKGHFSPNTRILAVHTGGLQGITGVNMRLRKKGAPLIQI